MKCPIFTIASTLAEKERGLFWYDCIKEGCAWWVENAQRCSIRCNAESLGQVALTAISLRKEEVK